MSELTSQQEAEMADRLLDGQIEAWEEERRESRLAARWPTTVSSSPTSRRWNDEPA